MKHVSRIAPVSAGVLRTAQSVRIGKQGLFASYDTKVNATQTFAVSADTE